MRLKELAHLVRLLLPLGILSCKKCGYLSDRGLLWVSPDYQHAVDAHHHSDYDPGNTETSPSAKERWQDQHERHQQNSTGEQHTRAANLVDPPFCNLLIHGFYPGPVALV